MATALRRARDVRPRQSHVRGPPPVVGGLRGVLVGAATLLLPVILAVLPAHAVMLTTFPEWRGRLRDCRDRVAVPGPDHQRRAPHGGVVGQVRVSGSNRLGITDLARSVTMIGDSEWTGRLGQPFALVLVVLAAALPAGAALARGACRLCPDGLRRLGHARQLVDPALVRSACGDPLRRGWVWRWPRSAGRASSSILAVLAVVASPRLPGHQGAGLPRDRPHRDRRGDRRERAAGRRGPRPAPGQPGLVGGDALPARTIPGSPP